LSRDASADDRLEAADRQRIDGDYEGAIAVYREVLETAGESAAARHGLGLALVFKGEFDEGLQELVRAAELEPDQVRYQLDLGKTYMMLGMYEEGRASMERVLELDPENDEARKQLSYF
jgi:Flp pilus assembly protein TadD